PTTRPPPTSPLFPYTTLFRSDGVFPDPLLQSSNCNYPSPALSFPGAFHEPVPLPSGHPCVRPACRPPLLRRGLRPGRRPVQRAVGGFQLLDRKSTRLNSSHVK